MTGGNGNDTYVVDIVGDTVTELSGEGIDTVLSSISYTLGDNLEKLVLTGIHVINGVGNALNNTLKGNVVANSLTGDAGSDTLNGGNGKDVFTGGLGKDKIVLTETVAATDTVKIATGESKVATYDTVTGFALGNGLVTKGMDQLDLSSTVIAANTVGVNGINSGVIRSHAVNNGIISFDDANTYSTALTLTVGNLNNVFSYLQSNIKASQTVAFNTLGNTYVFQDGGANDTLVQLTGITASNLNTSGLVADGVWLV
jgi:Ca2+-binding RTX toxin-like protein